MSDRSGWPSPKRCGVVDGAEKTHTGPLATSCRSGTGLPALPTAAPPAVPAASGWGRRASRRRPSTTAGQGGRGGCTTPSATSGGRGPDGARRSARCRRDAERTTSESSVVVAGAPDDAIGDIGQPRSHTHRPAQSIVIPARPLRPGTATLPQRPAPAPPLPARANRSWDRHSGRTRPDPAGPASSTTSPPANVASTDDQRLTITSAVDPG